MIFVSPYFDNHLQQFIILCLNKQEGHDGPGVAHLYIGPPGRGQFKPKGFYLNKLGRHPLEDVS
jgi:hypothetical protein